MRVARFVITGGTAFSINLALLYTLTEFLGLWYIFSATLSFLISLQVGFTMNKLWTFSDPSTSYIRGQMLSYLAINLFNLILNNSILYFLVEKFGIWYILAQAVASILIAFESFFVYKFLFRERLDYESSIIKS